MNAVTQTDTRNATRAPYKVDPTRGGHDGEVSMQWMARPHDERFLSLTEMWESKKAFFDGAWTQRTETNDFEMLAPVPETDADLHKLSIGLKVDRGDTTEAVEVTPTHWAFGQLCELAKTPSKLMRELPSQISIDVINFRMRHARSIETVKLFGGAESLYAATGPEYGRIPNHEMIAAVREFAGNGTGDMRWKIPGVLNWQTHMYDPEAPVTRDSTTLYASDRDCFIFLVDDRNPIEVGKLKDGSPDLMFRGFYTQNSEVGARSAKLASFYLRACCMNRNLWGVEQFEELTIIHSRNAVSRWLNEARPALRSFAEGSGQKLIEGVKMAKAATVASNDEEAIAFLKNRRSKFSAEKIKAILETAEVEEGRPARSAWDFAQALTATARSFPNNDDRLDYEQEARRILNKAVGVRENA